MTYFFLPHARRKIVPEAMDYGRKNTPQGSCRGTGSSAISIHTPASTMACFLMNAMPAGSGYPRTVIRVEDRIAG